MEDKEIIKKLAEEISNLKAIIDNEVMINLAYKEVIKKLELYVNTLSKINDEYATVIGKLKVKLQEYTTSSLD
jgi:hypothetical protein